jgi:hypothetical protein
MRTRSGVGAMLVVLAMLLTACSGSAEDSTASGEMEEAGGGAEAAGGAEPAAVQDGDEAAAAGDVGGEAEPGSPLPAAASTSEQSSVKAR